MKALDSGYSKPRVTWSEAAAKIQAYPEATMGIGKFIINLRVIIDITVFYPFRAHGQTEKLCKVSPEENNTVVRWHCPPAGPTSLRSLTETTMMVWSSAFSTPSSGTTGNVQ